MRLPASGTLRRWLPAATGVILVASLAAPSPAVASSVLAGIRANPAVGPPTTITEVTGRGFGPSEAVDLYFDRSLVGTVQTDDLGAFASALIVPSSALPGGHRIGAVGQDSGARAAIPFLVRTDWPKFQFDLANSGHNPYENVITPANAPTLTEAWVFEGGSVNGAPALAGGVLYSTGDTPTGDTLVSALKADTATVIWQRTIPRGSIHGVTYDQGSLYFGTDDCLFRSLDARTGATRWTAVSCTLTDAAVSEGVVYFGTTDGIHALDADTGDEVWTFVRTASFSSPAVVDGRVFAGIGEWLYALDAATGAPLWRFQTELGFVSSPAVSQGAVYIGSEEDTHLYALDAATGELRWEAPLGSPSRDPAVADGVVYIGTEDGVLYAFDASTGAQLWQSVGNYRGRPVVAGEVVFIDGTEEFEYYAVDASDGTQLWKFAAENFVSEGSVVANGMVFVGAQDRNLYAFELPG